LNRTLLSRQRDNKKEKRLLSVSTSLRWPNVLSVVFSTMRSSPLFGLLYPVVVRVLRAPARTGVSSIFIISQEAFRCEKKPLKRLPLPLNETLRLTFAMPTRVFRRALKFRRSTRGSAKRKFGQIPTLRRAQRVSVDGVEVQASRSLRLLLGSERKERQDCQLRLLR